MAAKDWPLTTPADDALKNSIPGSIRDVKEHTKQAGGLYSEQQSTPDQTIALYDGNIYFDNEVVEYPGLDIVDLGTSGGFEVSAMSPDYYNKVLFTIDSTGTLTAIEGTPNSVLGNVADPAVPLGEFPVCIVSVQDDGTGTAGTILSIEQSEIRQAQGTLYVSAGFLSGTSMIFNQAAAPTGWTKKSDWAANASLVVGNTYGSGGSDSPTSWETDVGVGAHSSHTHSGPSHTHAGPTHNHKWYNFRSGSNDQSYDSNGSALTLSPTTHGNYGIWAALSSAVKLAVDYWSANASGTTGSGGTGNTGSGGPTTHGVTQDTYTPIYQIMIAASKD